MLIFILIVILSIIIALRLYTRLTIGWCKSQTCLVGKTAIVTGANTGIGFETALDFAKRGARVILACRNEKKAEIARKRIINETDNNNVVVELIDLNCFDSVRAFAERINQREQRLDILVNNAGIGEISVKKTEDGLIQTMQINYFSVFLLTNLLIGLMKRTKKGRIVNVASNLPMLAFDFGIDKIVGIPKRLWFHKLLIYSYSKISLVLFTIELSRRLKGTEITAYSLHPGAVSTEIFRHLNVYMRFMVKLGQIFCKTCEEGAQTTIYCAVQKGIEEFSGDFFLDCERVSHYRTVTMTEHLLSKLWEVTVDVVKLKPEELVI